MYPNALLLFELMTLHEHTIPVEQPLGPHGAARAVDTPGGHAHRAIPICRADPAREAHRRHASQTGTA